MHIMKLMNQPDLKQLIFFMAMAVSLTLWLTTGKGTAEASLFESPAAAPSPAPTTSVPVAQPQQITPQIIATATTKPTPRPTKRPTTEPPANKGRSNLIFDQAEFIDTIALVGSWIWLCCGICLFLLVPLMMLLLQIRGHSQLKSKQQRQV